MSKGQYLLIDSEGPMIGPWVPCRRLQGVVTVTGITDGDRIQVIDRRGDGLLIDRDGDHVIMPRIDAFIRAIRTGSAGRVSVKVR